LSACNPEYGHELSFAGRRGARGDRGCVARFHRRDGLVRVLAAGTGGFLSEPANNVRRALCCGRRHRRLGSLARQQIVRGLEASRRCREQVGRRGVIGNDYVAKAPADGYTVLVAITQIIQAPSLVAKLPYDVFKDLAR